MFGQAEFCFARKLNKAVLVHSEENDDVVYQFRLRKRKADGTESLREAGRLSLDRPFVVLTQVQGGADMCPEK